MDVKKIWIKSWVRCLVITGILLLTLYFFRAPLLQGIGHWLVDGDKPERVDAIFVLGGNSYERGMGALEIHREFPDLPIIGTGGNISYQLLAFDTLVYEGKLTELFLEKNGVPDSLAHSLPSGTSTREEAAMILAECVEKDYRKVMIISSTFHLRRVRWVFGEMFDEHGIQQVYYGAASHDFSPENWWQREEGLITVNNELMKLLYYCFSG